MAIRLLHLLWLLLCAPAEAWPEPLPAGGDALIEAGTPAGPATCPSPPGRADGGGGDEAAPRPPTDRSGVDRTVQPTPCPPATAAAGDGAHRLPWAHAPPA